MTDEEFEMVRVQSHQSAELLRALIIALDDEFDGLREDIRDILLDRMRSFAATGSEPMAAANRDLAAGTLFSGL